MQTFGKNESWLASLLREPVQIISKLPPRSVVDSLPSDRLVRQVVTFNRYQVSLSYYV